VSNAEELEALEREIGGLTDELAGLLLEKHVQASLDRAEQKEKEAALVKALPGKLKNEGKEEVRIRTVSGLMIVVHTRYYRRRCDRRSRKRHKGVYAGLVLLGTRALHALAGFFGRRLVGVA